jgi:hypothetical protein
MVNTQENLKSSINRTLWGNGCCFFQCNVIAKRFIYPALCGDEAGPTTEAICKEPGIAFLDQKARQRVVVSADSDVERGKPCILIDHINVRAAGDCLSDGIEITGKSALEQHGFGRMRDFRCSRKTLNIAAEIGHASAPEFIMRIIRIVLFAGCRERRSC